MFLRLMPPPKLGEWRVVAWEGSSNPWGVPKKSSQVLNLGRFLGLEAYFTSLLMELEEVEWEPVGLSKETGYL